MRGYLLWEAICYGDVCDGGTICDGGLFVMRGYLLWGCL